MLLKLEKKCSAIFTFGEVFAPALSIDLLSCWIVESFAVKHWNFYGKDCLHQFSFGLDLLRWLKHERQFRNFWIETKVIVHPHRDFCKKAIQLQYLQTFTSSVSINANLVAYFSRIITHLALHKIATGSTDPASMTISVLSASLRGSMVNWHSLTWLYDR